MSHAADALLEVAGEMQQLASNIRQNTTANEPITGHEYRKRLDFPRAVAMTQHSPCAMHCSAVCIQLPSPVGRWLTTLFCYAQIIDEWRH